MKGQKTIHRAAFSRDKRVSLLCFLGANGLLNAYMTDGTFNRQEFVKCCRKFALDIDSPVRQYPGRYSLWIMDGAVIHLDEHFFIYLRSIGIIPLVLPSYCPFYNPIEIIFGLVKRKMRKLNTNNDKKDMVDRVSQALVSFKDKDCSQLFRKCGYLPNGKFDPSLNFNETLVDIQNLRQ